ncbi:cryptochrome/photolyase family protein [Aeromicrobium endophyticum]|uniref:Deoxyribodipyrimidine photo-lyase n=1 Tax=Aeromicrobium endophyticum TaxID=2292704 RepID=A0A371PD85_9ACTN|nr:deoxyribodipyrimidine photo-lyase [Aeromicrobium endophyticum]REK73877.1 deoxyribodipyrimidine photo-lyase [Aeromicrobium endophyticum]
MGTVPTSVFCFRSDFRLNDNPALREAIDAGSDGVVPMFVLDEHYWGPNGRTRLAYLMRLLRDLDERVGGLTVVKGKPEEVVPRVARAVGAGSVHVAADYGPYEKERDERIEQALADDDVAFVRTGSSYAVAPGRVTKDDGSPYRVFTPFYRAWQEHGWRAPAPGVRSVPWIRADVRTTKIPDVDPPDGVALPPLGEEAARRQWHAYLDHVDDYDDLRDLPGRDATSRMSVHLKWGTIHPRTMLADLGERGTKGAEAYARELAFREFYADVVHHRPDTLDGYYDKRFEAMDYNEPGDDLQAWKDGRTGFPIVDAGMRQLLAEGFVHNRVRMIVASFLVKDLHLEWTVGADHFLDLLVDADPPSNQHGWQWVAGCGTDASPYFRIFNPTSQGKKFDPDGSYVRRWVPELADVPAKHVHTPWEMDEPPADYPAPIVDHAEERAESLRRYEAIKSAR